MGMPTYSISNLDATAEKLGYMDFWDFLVNPREPSKEDVDNIRHERMRSLLLKAREMVQDYIRRHRSELEREAVLSAILKSPSPHFIQMASLLPFRIRDRGEVYGVEHVAVKLAAAYPGVQDVIGELEQRLEKTMRSKIAAFLERRLGFKCTEMECWHPRKPGLKAWISINIFTHEPEMRVWYRGKRFSVYKHVFDLEDKLKEGELENIIDSFYAEVKTAVDEAEFFLDALALELEKRGFRYYTSTAQVGNLTEVSVRVEARYPVTIIVELDYRWWLTIAVKMSEHTRTVLYQVPFRDIKKGIRGELRKLARSIARDIEHADRLDLGDKGASFIEAYALMAVVDILRDVYNARGSGGARPRVRARYMYNLYTRLNPGLVISNMRRLNPYADSRNPAAALEQSSEGVLVAPGVRLRDALRRLLGEREAEQLELLAEAYLAARRGVPLHRPAALRLLVTAIGDVEAFRREFRSMLAAATPGEARELARALDAPVPARHAALAVLESPPPALNPLVASAVSAVLEKYGQRRAADLLLAAAYPHGYEYSRGGGYVRVGGIRVYWSRRHRAYVVVDEARGDGVVLRTSSIVEAVRAGRLAIMLAREAWRRGRASAAKYRGWRVYSGVDAVDRVLSWLRARAGNRRVEAEAA